MSTPAPRTQAGLDLAALEQVTEAVESGAGLPEVARAAGRALDATLAVIDRGGVVLASTAPASSADERALLELAPGVIELDLRVADEVVGRLRLRQRAEGESALLRLVATLLASEVERVRAPALASEEAVAAFVRSLLSRTAAERDDIVARGRELAIDVERGGAVVVARAQPVAPAEDGWRRRFLATALRGARAAAPRTVAVLTERSEAGAEVLMLLPATDEAGSRRAGEALLRELEAALTGFSFAIGRSRHAEDPADLHRAANEALLAANVAAATPERPALAFDETGAYRLLLSAMSEDPAELQRFYAETVEPIVAYDDQYETELVRTLEAFLDADGNVANTAQRLFTHRHTVRYRLERVRDLSGLDVNSTDGREKLSLGLKAMRVLGIVAPVGPATEAGAGGGRVPRGPQGR
jgi:sugar diacid utilization regulator